MRHPLTIFMALLVMLLLTQGQVCAQTEGEKNCRIWPLAVKVQALSPLSNALYLVGYRSYDMPFSPRFYVVEVEKYFPGGHGLQAGFGARRRYEQSMFSPAFDSATGIKARLAYQRYFQHSSKRPLEGLFLTAGIGYISAKRGWSDGVDMAGGFRAQSIALDLGMGWSFLIKNRLLFQMSAGPQLGFQRDDYEPSLGGSYLGDRVSNFDYASLRFGERTIGDENRFWGLSAYLSCSIGWVFGN